ncbi:MAG: recombinase family protein, partial [Gammaproteobacteria bacterium]
MSIAVYVRVSTQRQAERQTIEEQLERLQVHVGNQGWELREEYIFRDDGYSGATLNRPGLDRLRDAIRAADVERVLMTDPDRLARNYVHQMMLLEEFERLGCAVEFLDRPMSQDPHDPLLLQIRGAVAEYERTLITERMRRGRQRKLQAGGLLPWTFAPYGYRVDPDRPRDPAGVHLEVAEAAVVKELFANYAAERASLFSLAKQLGVLGLPSPKGNPRWHPASIRGILSNPAYTRQVYAGRTRSRAARIRRSATHPIGKPGTTAVAIPRNEWIPVATIAPIVSQEQFDQVQSKLRLNQQLAGRNNKAHTYLLRALVSCGVCQLSCIARTVQSGYGYYVCRGKLDPIHSCQATKCPARFIPAHRLDEFVWQDLCELLIHPSSIIHALERAHGGHWLPQSLQARREQLRKGWVNLEHQLERLTQAYLIDVIPLPEYQRRRKALEEKSQALKAQAHQLEVQVDRQAQLASLGASIEDFCRRVQNGLMNATFEQKRQLVELLIDQVVVTNGDVEIRYVVPTNLSREQVRFCHLRKDYIDGPAFGVMVHELSGFGFGVARHQAPRLLHTFGLHAHDAGHRILFTGHGRLAKDPRAPVLTRPLRRQAGLAAGCGDVNVAPHPNDIVKAPVGLKHLEPTVVKEAAVGQHRHPNARGQDLGQARQHLVFVEIAPTLELTLAHRFPHQRRCPAVARHQMQRDGGLIVIGKVRPVQRHHNVRASPHHIGHPV